MQPPTASNVSAEPAAAPRHAAGSSLVSLAFWIALTSAAAILAAVQLSPGLTRWQHATRLHEQHAKQLQLLEKELQRLERLSATLAADPSFAAAVRAGGHSAAAARAQLNLDQTLNSPEVTNNPAEHNTPAAGSHPILPPGLRIPAFNELLQHSLLPAAHQLCASHKLRQQLLWLAAAITIFAFTCLNDSGLHTSLAVITLPCSITRHLWHRYRRIHQIPINPPEPVADKPVTIIIPQADRSDSSVGRATDS
jgi:hypothetical protein